MQKQDSIIPQEIYAHRFQELDALRGLAAFTVVLHHFSLIYPESRVYHLLVSTPLHLLVNGPEAVILFFLLSGFVLSSLWSRSRRAGYAAYSLKRLLRLCAPFYAALLIAWFLDAHFYSTGPTTNGWINGTWSERPTWLMALRTAATGLHQAQQFNTAFWSVTYEIRISLVFPLLYWMTMRLPTTGLLAGLLLFQAALPVTHVLDRFVEPGFAAAVIEFIIGILLYRELPRLMRWVSGLSLSGRALLLTASLLLYAVALQAPRIQVVDTSHPVEAVSAPKPAIDHSTRAKIGRGLILEEDVVRLQFAILGAAGVMLSAMAMPSFRKWLNQPSLLRLGALSYSTYLLHGSVLFLLIRSFYGRPFFPYLLPLYLLVVYAASELFHWGVDQPAILLGRRSEKWLVARQARSETKRQTEVTKA